MGTFDDILRWYNALVGVLLLLVGRGVPGRWVLFALHGAAFFLLPLLARWAGGTGFNLRSLLVRGAMAALFLPLVFTETGLLLPWVNPDPLEWHVVLADRALLGGRDVDQVTAFLRGGIGPDLLVLCYSTFYFLPLVLGAALLKRKDLAGTKELLLAVTFGFCASYLLYLAFPVLAPTRVLHFREPLEGGPVFHFLYRLLDGLELNKRDCFPSGHTWLTLTVLHLAWLRHRKAFFFLLPVGAGLILATVTLRFHYLVDVLAGALLYYPSMKAALWMDRRGGAWGGAPSRPVPARDVS